VPSALAMRVENRNENKVKIVSGDCSIARLRLRPPTAHGRLLSAIYAHIAPRSVGLSVLRFTSQLESQFMNFSPRKKHNSIYRTPTFEWVARVVSGDKFWGLISTWSGQWVDRVRKFTGVA